MRPSASPSDPCPVTPTHTQPRTALRAAHSRTQPHQTTHTHAEPRRATPHASRFMLGVCPRTGLRSPCPHIRRSSFLGLIPGPTLSTPLTPQPPRPAIGTPSVCRSSCRDALSELVIEQWCTDWQYLVFSVVMWFILGHPFSGVHLCSCPTPSDRHTKEPSFCPNMSSSSRSRPLAFLSQSRGARANTRFPHSSFTTHLGQPRSCFVIDIPHLGRLRQEPQNPPSRYSLPSGEGSNQIILAPIPTRRPSGQGFDGCSALEFWKSLNGNHWGGGGAEGSSGL